MDFLRSLFSSQPAGNPPDTQSSLLSRQEDIVDRRAVKPADTELHIMGSGPCNFTLVAGKSTMSCNCQQGVFRFQPDTPIRGNEECDVCGHPLSIHEKFSGALGQNSLLCRDNCSY